MIQNTINKELLGEVLGYKITNLSHNGYTNGSIGNNFMLHINPSQRRDRPSSCVILNESINIYELAGRYKQYIINNYEHLINSYLTEGNKYDGQVTVIYEGRELKYFEADTEPEAVIKACEWVFKEINK